MEKFIGSSAKEEKKTEIVCYGVACPQAESKKEALELQDRKFQNTDLAGKMDSIPLPKRGSLDAKELKIEVVPNSQSVATGKDEFESRKSPRKLKPITREVDRLEMQKETLERKVQVLKEKLAKGKHGKKNKESYLLQINNMEKKIEMLEKRIAYEKRITNRSLNRWKGMKNLSKASQSIYVNSMQSDEVLARKMREKLVLRKEEQDLNQETFAKKEKNVNKWESRWKELVLEEESDEEMEIYGFVIKKSKRTTFFYPPIPDPTAKKRPKDVTPLKESGSVKQGEPDDYKNKSKNRIRLVPNKRRVLTNRAKVYEKQLKFADKYGLEKKDIIENLNSYQQKLCDGELAPSVTKQQLHLIGALSEDHVSP